MHFEILVPHPEGDFVLCHLVHLWAWCSSQVAAMTGEKVRSHRSIVKKVTWCLAQAIRERHKKIILASRSATLIQDARQGRLLLRLHCVSDTYEVNQLCIGWRKGFEGTAEVGRSANSGSGFASSPLPPPICTPYFTRESMCP